MSWQPNNTAFNAQPKVTQSANCYLGSMTRLRSPYNHRAMRLTKHHVVGIKRQLFGHDKPSHAWAENRRQTPSELRRDAARYRGAAHPLCFTDEVIDHEFPEGFKPINIKKYDGTTDPAEW